MVMVVVVVVVVVVAVVMPTWPQAHPVCPV